MRTGLIVIWFLGIGITSAAQVYQTQLGTIMATGMYKGTSVAAVSNHLFMHLNYENAQLHLRLMIPTFVTENDSLNEILHKLLGQELAFEGKMNIAFIQTKSHPRQKFATQGLLFLNGITRPYSFSSVLEHFPRANTSCILSGEFIIDLKQFNIKNLPPGEEKITVKFNQLVLKKSGD